MHSCGCNRGQRSHAAPVGSESAGELPAYPYLRLAVPGGLSQRILPAAEFHCSHRLRTAVW